MKAIALPFLLYSSLVSDQSVDASGVDFSYS